MNKSTVDAEGQWTGYVDEPKNAPELPIGRFLKSESLGGNRVILTVRHSTRTAWQCSHGNRQSLSITEP